MIVIICQFKIMIFNLIMIMKLIIQFKELLRKQRKYLIWIQESGIRQIEFVLYYHIFIRKIQLMELIISNFLLI